jgi:hypothetical protein
MKTHTFYYRLYYKYGQFIEPSRQFIKMLVNWSDATILLILSLFNDFSNIVYILQRRTVGLTSNYELERTGREQP